MQTSQIVLVVVYSVITVALVLTWFYLRRRRPAVNPVLLQLCGTLAVATGLLTLKIARKDAIPRAADGVVTLLVLVLALVAAARYLTVARPRQRAALEARQTSGTDQPPEER